MDGTKSYNKFILSQVLSCSKNHSPHLELKHDPDKYIFCTNINQNNVCLFLMIMYFLYPFVFSQVIMHHNMHNRCVS